MIKPPNFLKRPFNVILLVVFIGIIIFSAFHKLSIGNNRLFEGLPNPTLGPAICSALAQQAGPNGYFHTKSNNDCIQTPLTSSKIFSSLKFDNGDNNPFTGKTPTCALETSTVDDKTNLKVGCKIPNDPSGSSIINNSFNLTKCQQYNGKYIFSNNSGKLYCNTVTPGVKETQSTTRPPIR